MRMIARHHDQRVGVLRGEVAGDGHGLVELDRLDHGAVPVQRVRHLVDRGRLDHQEEAVFVPGQLVQRRFGHLDQARLVRELVDGALLQLVAVQPGVHVAGVEQAQDLAAVGAARGVKLGRVGRQRIARVAEHLDIVLIVLAFRAGHVRLQEIGRAAAQHHLGLDVVEHADDIGLVRALAGVGDHRRGRRVLQFRGGDDAHRTAAGAAQRLGDGFDLGVVLAGRGAVGIDAQRVHPAFVPGHVGRHGVGRVGRDGMRR